MLVLSDAVTLFDKNKFYGSLVYLKLERINHKYVKELFLGVSALALPKPFSPSKEYIKNLQKRLLIPKIFQDVAIRFVHWVTGTSRPHGSGTRPINVVFVMTT
jgi:hypothetical protein